MPRKFLITGSVKGSQSSRGLGSLIVEAWDKDLICDDLLGRDVTDERGEFRIEFDESYFREVFFDRRPDLLFKVFRVGQLLEADAQVMGRHREGFEVQIVVSQESSDETGGDRAPAQYFEPPQPAKLANLSELHYRRIELGASVHEHRSRESRGEPPSHGKRKRRPHYSARVGLRWNSEVARRTLGSRVTGAGRPRYGLSRQFDLRKGPSLARVVPELNFTPPEQQLLTLKDWNGVFVCTPPNMGAQGWWPYNDNLAGTIVYHITPMEVFASEPDPEQASRDFLSTVRASMPMFLPYREGTVQPVGGWFYQGGGFHGAIDYVKTDTQDIAANGPSFGVYAVASGTVVSVDWSDLSGNYVIIEHVAGNGDRYRSLYLHLRNGATNDLNRALSVNLADAGGDSDRAQKYINFAQNEDPNNINVTNWGTEEQTIQVSVGDSVYTGQFVGWSGNTGFGGAGNGLNNDGTPGNPATANNHLHFEMAVPDPTPGSLDWLMIDPYGVYEQIVSGDGSKCYELGEHNPFVRLFAPFYPDFFNVPFDHLMLYWGYYPGMGMALQTVSVHRRNDTLLVSGSFQYGLSWDWLASLYMTSEEFDSWYWHPDNNNYRVRQITVTTDSAGNARFSVIAMPWGNEGFYTYWDMTQAQWDATWESLVINDNYRVEDHAVYEVQGTVYHAAVFINDGDANFGLWEHASHDGFQVKFNEYDADGFKLTSINAEELSTGLLFTGIWRMMLGWWPVYYDMTGEWFQSKYLELAAEGYRMHKIQGYSNSDLFAAVWVYD